MGFKFTILVCTAAVIVGNYLLKQEPPPEPSPIVETSYGKLEGVTGTSREGRIYYEYMGIPYAKPPVGARRFESPEEPEHWKGIRKADKYGFECPQFNKFIGSIVGNEDCLFLNVYTPKAALDETVPKLPVMVFIHGGLFVFGSGNGYRPEYFMDHEDIVLVTLNYRLGSLGFLNTGNGAIRGNMGLKDQTLALKWVQKNIEHFGGDPGKVTIFGESAGGASVHLQILSPTAKGLFQQAIIQSGVALNYWAIKPSNKIKEQANRYAAKLNCSKLTTKEIIDCLKSVSVEAILDVQSEAQDTFRDPITLYTPSVETINDQHTFLPEHPLDLLKTGKFNKVPMIIGYNSHEGLLSVPDLIKNETKIKRFDQEFEKVVPPFMFYHKSGPEAYDDMKEMREYYFGKNVRIDNPDQLQNYASLFTDWVWAVGAQQSAQYHAKHSPTYTYYYSYKGEFQLAKILMTLSGEPYPMLAFLWNGLKEAVNKYVFGREPVHFGAGHGDELGILFKMPRVSNLKLGHKDYLFSKDLVNLWVSFAKQEKPLRFKGHEWNPLEPNSESLHFLLLDTVSGIIPDPHPERIQFMLKYHPK